MGGGDALDSLMAGWTPATGVKTGAVQLGRAPAAVPHNAVGTNRGGSAGLNRGGGAAGGPLGSGLPPRFEGSSLSGFDHGCGLGGKPYDNRSGMTYASAVPMRHGAISNRFAGGAASSCAESRFASAGACADSRFKGGASSCADGGGVGMGVYGARPPLSGLHNYRPSYPAPMSGVPQFQDKAAIPLAAAADVVAEATPLRLTHGFASDQNVRFRKYMEDEHTAVVDFAGRGHLYAGLYDGHGGRQAVDFINDGGSGRRWRADGEARAWA